MQSGQASTLSKVSLKKTDFGRDGNARTRRTEDKCLGRLFWALSLLLLQWLQFTAYWVLCSLRNLLFFHFTLGERSPGMSCPRCWNHSFAKLNRTLFNPLGSCCFPAKLSERLVLFVTVSSGMTCNTSNLTLNPQWNSNSELRASFYWNPLLRFLSSGSKWAKSMRNGVSFGNEKTQVSLRREKPGQRTARTEEDSQWDPQRKDSGPNSHKGFY